MNYYSIKLKSGELFACQSDQVLNADVLMQQPWITIEHPVQFVSFKFADYDTGEIIETVSMAPLVPTSEDRLLTISSDSIILIASLRPTAIEKYQGFIERMEQYIAQGGKEYSEDVDSDQNQSQEQPTDEQLTDMLTNLDITTKVLH
jgi:hypothetical protein